MSENVDASNGRSAEGGGSASTDNHRSLAIALATAIEEAVKSRSARIEAEAEAARRREETDNLRLENMLLKQQLEESRSTDEAKREVLFAALEDAVKERAARIDALERNADNLRSENMLLRKQAEESRLSVAAVSSTPPKEGTCTGTK